MSKKENIVHETVVRDIVDIVTDIKDTDEVKSILNWRNGRSFKSAAKASSDLTLVFPVIVDDTISIGSAMMITKAIERKAVSMMQILFSALSVSSSDNVFEYIKKFHTNMKFDDNISVDQFINLMDDYVIKNESAGITVVEDKEKYEAVKRDLRRPDYFFGEDVNDLSLNDFRKVGPLWEAPIGYYSTRTALAYDVAQKQAKFEKDRSDAISKQLLPSDVKKANELVPTMMTINFCAEAKSGEYYVPVTAVVGIKAKMYPVSSSDIVNRIVSKYTDKNSLLKLIKSTTKEISFFKDFLFAIDKAKIDALSQSRRGSSSKMWKILERRCIKSRVRRMLGSVNDASAITTLVLSSITVEAIKREYNIDVGNSGIIRPIMEAYNLMSTVIVDESLEYANFIFDTGDDEYETITFNALERESGDNNYKKIINLMTKVAR